MLVDELRAIGLDDADARRQRLRDGHAAGRRAAATPVIGLIAHVDTSPDAPGAGVEPIVHRGYDGGVDRAAARRHRARPRDDADLRDAVRPRHRHLERRHAAGRRRQGRRGRDHGRGRAPGAPTRSCRARRCASASRPTRRSARARRCSTSSASARAAPTRSTARRSASCRTRPSPRAEAVVTHRAASTSTPASPPASSSTPRGSPARIARRAARRSSRRRRRRAATASSTSTRSQATPARPSPRDRARLRRRQARGARRRCCARTAEEVVGARAAARGSTSRSSRSTRTCARYLEPHPEIVDDGRARRSAPRASSRSASRSAAAPTARCLSARGPADAEHLRRRPRVPLGARVGVGAGHGRGGRGRSCGWPASGPPSATEALEARHVGGLVAEGGCGVPRPAARRDRARPPGDRRGGARSTSPTAMPSRVAVARSIPPPGCTRRACSAGTAKLRSRQPSR